MKFATVAALVSATLASAVPTRRAAAVTDTDILQYALTLEHLENAFYSQALSKYDSNAFSKAGFPAWVRGRFEEIAGHEAQHVTLLSGAIGAAATKPCNYSFPYTDPASFAGLASVIEGAGVSAYLGAAAFITEKAYVTVAGSILTTESRHQAWISAAVNKVQPWSAPEDTPLSFSQVYTIAAGFITGCPSSNPALPVKAFPALTGSPANAKSGTSVTFSFKPASGSAKGTYYAVFYSGLTATSVKLDNMKATVPPNIIGTYYTVISTVSGNVTDDNTVAGPLISVVNFPA